MTSSVTMNAFALLGDTEVDDPELISATIRKPEPAAPVKPAPEKPKKAPAPGAFMLKFLSCVLARTGIPQKVSDGFRLPRLWSLPACTCTKFSYCKQFES